MYYGKFNARSNAITTIHHVVEIETKDSGIKEGTT